MKNKHDEIIDKITDISEKYEFEYLDQNDDINELKLEYVGDDIIIKYEEDFERYEEWREIVNEQSEIVEREFEKAIKEIKKSINVKEYVYDDCDYPCVYLYYNI